MFFLVKDTEENNVIGIINEHDVLGPSDYEDIKEQVSRQRWPKVHAYQLDRGTLIAVIKVRLIYIIEQNLTYDPDPVKAWWSRTQWRWEEITQAEYETYRDLHEFRVFKKLNLTCPSGTKR